MAFKGEISAEYLDNIKTGFTVGDIYRIIDAGKLGGIDIPFGTFVEWTGTAWKVNKDMQYAISKTGASLDETAVSLEEVFFANMEVPARTLRFSFGDLSYDPTKDTNTKAAGAHSGTWTKLKTYYTNIWDYTITGTTLASEFAGTSASNLGPWNDNVNNPVKIINSNTANITDFSRCFAWNYGITEVQNPIDTRDATTCILMFNNNVNLEKGPNINGTSTTGGTTLAAIYQNCKMLKNSPVITNNSLYNNYSYQTLYKECKKMQSVSVDCAGVLDLKAIFYGDSSLTKIELENNSAVTGIESAFRLCTNLTNPNIQIKNLSAFSNVVDAKYAFAAYDTDAAETYYESNMTVFPIDLPLDKVTACDGFVAGTKIKHIPELNMPAVTQCPKMFKNCKDVETGILRAYTYLESLGNQITNHTECFKNCGINTPTGRAELEQIPASWGGLAS